MKSSDKVQIAIFIVLTCTAIFIGYSVWDQVTFNKNALRPWVNCKPIGDILVDKHRISFTYEMKNFGQTPALNLRSYSMISLNIESFPSDSFKIMMENDTNPTISSIFPLESHPAENSLKYSDWLSCSDLEQAIQHNRLFLHIYISYSDISQRNLGHRFTTQLKYKSENRKGKSCACAIIYTSEAPIK